MRALALVVLVLVVVVPLASADPEVLDVSEATVFVDGSVDYFQLNGLTTQTVIEIRGPAGDSLSVVMAQQSSCRIYFDGTFEGSCAIFVDQQIVGDLSGTPVDGTWTITTTHGTGGGSDSNRLSIQGLQFRFTVPIATSTQTWNWHMGNGTDIKGIDYPDDLEGLDGPADSPQEDPNNARYFTEGVGDPTPGDGSPIALTGGSQVTCTDQAQINGTWIRGLTQTSNTWTRFAWIQGDATGDTDLRDNVGATLTTLTDQGAGENGTDTEVIAYNNAAGNSYQFLARNDTDGPESLGTVQFIAAEQCDLGDPPSTNGYELDPSNTQLTVSQAQCSGDLVGFTIATEGSGDLELNIIRNADSTLVQHYDESDMGTNPGARTLWVNGVFPPGAYTAIALQEVSGFLNPDKYAAAAFNVPASTCIAASVDLGPLLVVVAGLLEELEGHNGTMVDQHGTILDALALLGLETMTGFEEMVGLSGVEFFALLFLASALVLMAFQLPSIGARITSALLGILVGVLLMLFQLHALVFMFGVAVCLGAAAALFFLYSERSVKGPRQFFK